MNMHDVSYDNKYSPLSFGKSALTPLMAENALVHWVC